LREKKTSPDLRKKHAINLKETITKKICHTLFVEETTSNVGRYIQDPSIGDPHKVQNKNQET
jgi:hypothetical protein